MMIDEKRLVRTVVNVRDLQTGELVRAGMELELSVARAGQWVAMGMAEFVEGSGDLAILLEQMEEQKEEKEGE